MQEGETIMNQGCECVRLLLGIPFDAHSSYLRGAGEAPAKIREALACDASNRWTELGVDLGVARSV